MLNKSRSKNTTNSNTTANSTGNQPQNNDSDDYLLRNENEALSAVIAEGNDITNERLPYVDAANHIIVDSSAQSMINSHRSIDSNMNRSFEAFKSSSSSEEDEDAQNKQKVIDSSVALERTPTRLWSPKMKFQRKKILKQYLKMILFYALFCFTILVFVFGAVYNTKSHYRKIKILAVLQDDSFSSSTDIQPVTDIFPTLIDQAQGDWHVYNESTFKLKYNLQTTQQIDEKIVKLIYDEHYWLALNVKPNITTNLVDSITIQNQTAFNATDFFQIVYESGRDPSHVKVWILPRVTAVETAFNQYCMDTYMPSLIKNITTSTPSTIINWENVASMMNMQFETVDYRPFYDRILLIATQIGGIFAMLLTVFQFSIQGKLHGQVAPLLRQRSRIYYRIIISMLTHFFASLFWCTVSAIYQLDFTIKYGRGGFMVYWMTMWMFMWACGSINENVISIIISVYPQYVGFWILGFSLCNISTGFFPMVLDNNFYRIGYALPLRNMIDLNRSTLLGVSNNPAKLGRCYGVFTAWIVVNTALLPFVMKWSKKLSIWKAKRVARQLAEEKEMMKQFK
ncbi:nitrosoguanidine resistance protein Sng1p [Monosporozyma servazzii]